MSAVRSEVEVMKEIERTWETVEDAATKGDLLKMLAFMMRYWALAWVLSKE